MEVDAVKHALFFSLTLFFFACQPASHADTQLSEPWILYGTPDTSPAHQAVVYISMLYGGYGGACSGTLITQNVVLTAAHCAAAPQNMRVYIGNSVNTFAYELGVSQVTVHPDWDPNFQQTNNLANDIALLRLSSSAPSQVVPIPYLPSSLALTSADLGTTSLTFVGFGLTETGTSGTKLKMSQSLFNICDGPNACNVNIPNVGYAQVPPNTIGIRMNSAGGICSGDSGGPALVIRSGVEYVAGVNSFVLQNSQNECDYFGASTKVDRFNSFIANFLGIATENCTNSTDDDNDGVIDCNDPDCATDPGCRPTSCQMFQPISCGSTISSSTLHGVASYANYSNNCTGGYAMSGPEVVFKVLAGTGTQVTARLTVASSGTDLDMLLLRGTCDPAHCITGSLNPPGQEETLTFTMDQVDTYLVIETYQNPGSFTLQLTCENEQPVVENCNNNLDDDNDSQMDCDDPDCQGSPHCPLPPENCADGIDNDGDEHADCTDADCFDQEVCRNAVEDCSNGMDDDYDHFADCADADCLGYPGCALSLDENCTNGKDDDNDGYADCTDPLCRTVAGCHPGLENCADGTDNDADGRTDCSDADCQTFAACAGWAELCFNDIDDDEDGRIDCEDPKCASFTPCLMSAPWTKEYNPDKGCSCRIAGSRQSHLHLFGALVVFAFCIRRWIRVG